MNKDITLALGRDFLNSFSALPRVTQGKVRNFIERFRANPKSAAIHYEHVSEFRDKKLRSVRIDHAYRGILLDTGEDSTFIFLWVDHHDRAYGWAKNKMFSINPGTGFIQYLDSRNPAEVRSSRDAGDSGDAGAEGDGSGWLFGALRDRELIRLGIPEEQIPFIRSIADEEELSAGTTELSPEVREVLQFLAAGISVEDLERELTSAAARKEPVDTEDYRAALKREGTARNYALITDDDFLRGILKYPLEQWRVFLHPAQRALVEKTFAGPARVLGGPGTGKTVVAMHRARYLAGRLLRLRSRRNILFTTFSKNLADNIRRNLRLICSDEEFQKIEVENLDSWASKLLQSRGMRVNIADPKKVLELWLELGDILPDRNSPEYFVSFYRWEWEKYVQQNGIRSLEEYIRIDRRGAGTRLNRRRREEVWKVLALYRKKLEDRGWMEYEDVLTEARCLLEGESGPTAYAHVIVDEAQDFSVNAFRLITRIVAGGDDGKADKLGEDSLFIAGDSRQRIYGRKAVLGDWGIRVRGRSRILKTNYRTTEEISRFALGILRGADFDDLDGGPLDELPSVSLFHGEEPVMLESASFAEELRRIGEHIATLRAVSPAPEAAREGAEGAVPQNICLVVRPTHCCGITKADSRQLGIQAEKIEGEGAPPAGDVLIATMYGVKGLEFDHVILVGASAKNLPNRHAMAAAPTRRELAVQELRERSLIYTALSRARKSAALSWHGERSPLLPEGG